MACRSTGCLWWRRQGRRAECRLFSTAGHGQQEPRSDDHAGQAIIWHEFREGALACLEADVHVLQVNEASQCHRLARRSNKVCAQARFRRLDHGNLTTYVPSARREEITKWNPAYDCPASRVPWTQAVASARISESSRSEYFPNQCLS